MWSELQQNIPTGAKHFGIVEKSLTVPKSKQFLKIYPILYFSVVSETFIESSFTGVCLLVGNAPLSQMDI